MKKRVMLTLGLTGMLLGTAAVCAYASSSDIKLFVNGKEATAPVEIIDGSSYVPLRAVAEMLGVEVNWDGDKREITIGTSTGTNSLPTEPTPGKITTTASVSAKPGFVNGMVTDASGNPLSGVLVRVGGMIQNGGPRTQSSFETNTDASGMYELQLPEGLYHVNAWVQVPYHGQQYSLPLFPLDKDNPYDKLSSEGIVKNFVWNLSGPMPSKHQVREADEYYGGVIIFSGQAPMATSFLADLPANSDLELTLVPDGPLIDGSDGQVITLHKQLTKSLSQLNPMQKERTLNDIPIGKYTVSAKVTEPGGASQALRIATDAAPEHASSVSITFAPFGGNATPYNVNGMNATKIYLSY